MDWDTIRQEEVQDQLNDDDKYDKSAIYIIQHCWKSTGEKVMVKVTGLHGLGKEEVENEYVNIEYPDTLALYFMGSCIEVKSSHKSCFYVQAKEWR